LKTIVDPKGALSAGLAAIRKRFQVPAEFPADVLTAAEVAARRTPDAHADRTDAPFVTLDPATSTDLDQAFTIERSGADFLLHYAIADVAWFVDEDGPIDREAWRRGATLYLPDGKARLYPAVLSEDAASLLPDGPRPAVIFTVRVAPDGGVRLDGAERAVIRSRAKLAYDIVSPADLPQDFAAFAARIQAAEAARGAQRVDPPEQEVAVRPDGALELRFRPRTPAEDQNAALSLAANLAVAEALQAARTGLFRVMPEPDARAVSRLRHTARAFGIAWPRAASLAEFEHTLSSADPKHAAMMLAVRRAGQPAGYAPFQPEAPPWHAAVAATYAHATAPLRRLADRYVVMAALAIANGQPPPASAVEAFQRLPDVMAKADARGGQIERAVIDLAEIVVLQGREGDVFDAVVTDIDERGARIQLCDLPVVARVPAQAAVGEPIRARLVQAEPTEPVARFEAA
jgi:VacB/RNase II family 3'-5' exoribonuclease